MFYTTINWILKWLHIKKGDIFSSFLKVILGFVKKLSQGFENNINTPKIRKSVLNFRRIYCVWLNRMVTQIFQLITLIFFIKNSKNMFYFWLWKQKYKKNYKLHYTEGFTQYKSSYISLQVVYTHPEITHVNNPICGLHWFGCHS